jgi:hypothetical protein
MLIVIDPISTEPSPNNLALFVRLLELLYQPSADNSRCHTFTGKLIGGE